jgi:hypothetical protein
MSQGDLAKMLNIPYALDGLLLNIKAKNAFA